MTADLGDPGLFASGDFHAVLDRLRDTAPVYWNATADGSGFWALTRYDDVTAVYRDPSGFSSAYGVMLGGSYRTGTDSASGEMLLVSDPPRHSRLREMVHPAFGPATLDRIRVRTRERTAAGLARLIRDGGGDVATGLGPEIPAVTLAVLFGLPATDAGYLVDLIRQMIGYRETGEDDRLRLAGVQGEIFAFFYDLLEQRRDRPGDDVLGTLVSATVNGEPVDDEKILYNCLNIAVGASETSGHVFCSGLLALSERPGDLAALWHDPAGLVAAVNEIQRWASVNAYVKRVATEDTTIAGTPIAAGDVVTLWNVAANRDPAHFAGPHAFDVARTPNRHLAFGHGIHRCIGATVGMAGLTAAFGELAALDGPRLRPARPPSRLRSNFILGYTSVPFEVVP